MYDCLESIIGITQSACSCVVEGLTNDELTGEWYKESTSGLYMDEQEGMISIKALGEATECVNEMAQMYYDTRKNAIRQLGDDFLAGIKAKYKKRNRNYTGKIGATTFSGSLNITNDYAGLKLPTSQMKGGYVKITKVTTMMNADATFNIHVYKLDNDADEYELQGTIENIESLANAKKENTLAEPVIIYLSEFGADYFLLYEPDGFQPKANAVSCGCGGNETLLKPFLSVRGVSGNDLTTLDSWATSSYANGLSLYAEVGCDESMLVCEVYQNDSRMANVMAWAIRFRADAAVLQKIYKSGNINRYTMMSSESLQGTRNSFDKQYNDRIAWLVQHADGSLIGCYVCNNTQLKKTGILV